MSNSKSSDPAGAIQPAGLPVPVVASLRGIGQIMFQENALTGLLFVIGIAAGAPIQAAGIVAGAFLGTVTACLLGFDPKQRDAGIYGFNPALVGIATLFFFQPGVASLALLVVGSVAATVLTYAMRTFLPFPTYTTPFIVTTWVIVLIGPSLGAVKPTAGEAPAGSSVPFVVEATVNGIGQVMFQGTLAGGLLFLVGLTISDRKHATWVLLGSVVGMCVACFHLPSASQGLDPEQLVMRSHYANIALGLYGYNATLAAVALFLWRPSVIPPLLGMCLAVPLTEVFPLIGIPALTAPFVLATWIVIALGHTESLLIKPTPGKP